MDWKRAQNILIVMFLIICIFLFYQLIIISTNQYKYTDRQELDSVIKYMNSKNISIAAKIPSTVNVIPSLRVKYKEFNAEILGDTIIGAGKYSVNTVEDIVTINGDAVSVEIRNSVSMTYKNQAIISKDIKQDEDKCLKNAYSFIDKLKLNTSNKYVILKEIQPGYIHLILGQKYKGLPVENSQIEIIATPEGVADARVSWFEDIKADKKENITTPIVALLKAAGKREGNEKPAVVQQISQGYFFNVGMQDKVEGNVVLEGIAYPVWIVEMDNKQIYINAYNEKIEQTR